MILADIKKALKLKRSIDGYQVSEVKTSRFEAYFILDKVETIRQVEDTQFSITIYKNHDGFLGSSSFKLNCNATIDDLNNKINEAKERTLLVNNKPYELPVVEEITRKLESNIEQDTLENIALNVSKAIFKANVYKDGWINSTEIFVTKDKHHFINSNGIDVEYTKCNLFIELIPTWKGEKEEVELYYSTRTSEINYAKITEDVIDILMQAKYRGEAQTVTDEMLNVPVILRANECSKIFDFFAYQMSYQSQYRHMANYKIDDYLGTSFNLSMEPILPNSTGNAVIDSMGKKLEPIQIIQNGKYINYFGDVMHGQYLGIKNPTGRLENYRVSTITSQKYSELASTPHIEILSFSAFQLDDFSGYYGGEVRLGLYYDGTKDIPISGFSVSGNIFEDIKTMQFSQEVANLNYYEGPKYLKVKMSINK